MHVSVEHLVYVFALSSGFWLIFGFVAIFRIKGFIVRRYEQETRLGQTLYFSTYMPFAKYLPDFFSSGFYAAHLLGFVWFWNVIRFIKANRPKVSYFDDIDTPEEVTKHFTKKEIRSIKRLAIVCCIASIHVVVFYTVKLFWPEVLA